MPDSARQKPYTAIILAGERGPGDPLAMHASACCKAMVEIDGTPMILRVLAALESAVGVGRCLLSGPGHEKLASGSPLGRLIETKSVDWCEPESTPSTSAYSAMQRVPADLPVLVTTADHPLLTAEIVDDFCARSLARGVDVTVGLAPYSLVKAAYPDMKKTVLRFRDGDFCGCNLFAFLTAEGRRMADYWRRVETQRKNPVRIIRILGWGAVIRYLMGRLTLQNALESLSRRLHLRLGAVILPYAEAAIDIDSIADHAIVQKKLSQQAKPQEDHGNTRNVKSEE
jgi:GTP:adenosylcobinamide-phosphate guanylyltransferase